MSAYVVEVMEHRDFGLWVAHFVTPDPETRRIAIVRWCHRHHVTRLAWMGFDGSPSAFAWVCPRCGTVNQGYLESVEPESTTDERWTQSGDYDVPNLSPELACYVEEDSAPFELIHGWLVEAA